MSSGDTGDHVTVNIGDCPLETVHLSVGDLQESVNRATHMVNTDGVRRIVVHVAESELDDEEEDPPAAKSNYAESIKDMSSEDTGDHVTVNIGDCPLDTVHLSVGDLQESVNRATHTVNTDGVRQIVVHVAESELDEEEDDPPAAKRFKSDCTEAEIVNNNMSIKQILFNINKAICLRLDGIEHKVENACARLRDVEDKLMCSAVLNTLQKKGTPPNSRRSSAVIVGLPQENSRLGGYGNYSSIDPSIQNLGPNVTLITLNTEDDYPNGCWLGNDGNPEMRVRAPVTPSDLLHIHSNCRTAEKMALTLLDYLFDRETQANSNLSGMGKHGKKQLDPLMIYGIRCHLIHRFAITENDWHRIKQNIDSKCRTAFRRKQKGMPLTVKAFRGKTPAMVQGMPGEGLSDEDSYQEGDLHIQQGEVDIQHAVAMQGTGLPPGEIQILHATPEQISQLQHAHHIQILQGDHVIQQIQGADGSGNVHVAVSLPNEVIQVAQITTDGGGEVFKIQEATGVGVETQPVLQH